MKRPRPSRERAVAYGVRVWRSEQDRLIVAGSFPGLEVHYHPAVQVTVGVAGPVEITGVDGGRDTCRLVVVAGGARHAVRPDAGSAALSIYLGPATRQGLALSALSRIQGQNGGVWIVEDGGRLADATASALAAGGPGAAADFLVSQLCGTSSVEADHEQLLHPQLRHAIELVPRSVLGHSTLASAARAVALSPDYLGRLCKQQTGVSFSATIRWARLLTFLSHLADGASLTDAAHLAGFFDSSHANRACWEMGGAAPSVLVRALRGPQLAWPLNPDFAVSPRSE